jgi:hypothetical protein
LRQRFAAARAHTVMINCIVLTLNRIYSPSCATPYTSDLFLSFKDSAIRSSYSFPPSMSQSRVLLFISTSVRSFSFRCRGLDTIASSHAASGATPVPFRFVFDFVTDMIHNLLFRPRPQLSFSLPASTSASIPDTCGVSPQPLSLFSLYSSSSPSYFSSLPTPILPLIASEVSLPSPGECKGIPLLDLLPPVWHEKYLHSTSGLLKPPIIGQHDLSALALPRPRVHGSHTQWLLLVARLCATDMISFAATSEVACINGVFVVPKDETPVRTTRLIIDARYANALFVEPTKVKLPTPAHLVALQLPMGQTLYKAKTDLSNFYHHLMLPSWMCTYFALPPVRVCDLPTAVVAASTFLASLPPTALVCPVLRRLAMGFSHAVTLAQCCHEHVLYSSGALLRSHNIINLLSPTLSPPSLVVHAIYVDDDNLLGTDQEAVQRVYDAVLVAYKRHGLTVKASKLVPPTATPVPILGVLVHGDGIISAPADKLQSLVSATMHVLSAGRASGTLVARIVGSWSWWLLLRRFMLSLFHHVYRYIAIAADRQFVLWPSVSTELAMVISLMPLMYCNITAPFFRKVLATDASTSGGGMVVSNTTRCIIDSLWPIAGVHVHELINVDDGIPRVAPSDLLQPFAASTSASPGVSILGSAAYHTVSDPGVSHWYTVLSFPWSYTDDHINVLELRMVHMALRWVLSHPRSTAARILHCIDSAASYYAVRKGRSTKLLTTIRKVAALALASGVAIDPVWLPSELNPADQASRVYDKRKRIGKQRQ